MTLWVFWSKEALWDNMNEFFQEALMGNDEHNIKSYQFYSFNGQHPQRAEILELPSQVESLTKQVESLTKQVKDLSEQLQAKSKQVDILWEMLNRAQVPDVSGKPVSRTPRPAAAPPRIQQTPVRDGVFQTESFPRRFKILFRENAGNYDRVLQNFEEEAKKLKHTAERILSHSVSDESAFLNLIDKCIRDFASLREKSADANASDMAEKSAKILKKTVCKALTQCQLKRYIESYLQSCGVEKLGWQVGRKLTDKDYAYLEEPVFYDETPEPRYDGVITKIEQDSYVIGYEEDGVPHRALIPGTYHIGKYRGPAAYQRP